MLAGEDCEYNNADPDDAVPIPQWPMCSAEGAAGVAVYSIHEYTDPEATFIWVIIYFILAILWGLTACGLLLGFFSSKSRSKALAVPWVATTGVILFYGMMAAIVYMTDLSIPLVRAHLLENEKP